MKEKLAPALELGLKKQYLLKCDVCCFQRDVVAPRLHFETETAIEYSDVNVIAAHSDVLAPAETARDVAVVAAAAVAAAAVAAAAVAAAAVAAAAVAAAAVAAAALDDAKHAKAATLADYVG